MDSWDPVGVRDAPQAQDEYDAGVVVSMFSVIERKPAPALAIRSMMG
jgi:hypothetical protein